MGSVLLQAWLTFLWPERGLVGLAMPLTFELMPETRIPHLGHWLYFFPLALLSVGALSRFVGSHPRAISGLSLSHGALSGRLGGWGILAALYAAIGSVAAAVEHLLFHHFETAPGHHVAIVVLLVGATYAGRRRPFRRVRLSPPAGRAERDRRRRADALCLALFSIAYASWTVQPRLSLWTYRLGPVGTALLVLATVPPAALFGWALLHGSLVVPVGHAVRALEGLARSVRTRRRPSRRAIAFVDGLAHVSAAAAVLAGARWLWRWGHGARSGPVSAPFLGVDWYFLDLWSGVTAAEIAIVGAAAVLAGALVPRPWSPPMPRTDRSRRISRPPRRARPRSGRWLRRRWRRGRALSTWRACSLC
ncbi:MAG: hypothetical protein R2991_16485 [Thermoanaerobaculia bacterium]